MFTAQLNYTAHDLNPPSVAGYTRPAPGLCPTAVAVHNNSEVLWDNPGCAHGNRLASQ